MKIEGNNNEVVGSSVKNINSVKILNETDEKICQLKLNSSLCPEEGCGREF